MIRNIVAGSLVLLLSSCSSIQKPSESTEAINSTIKIGGSSETYEVLELLTEAYQAKTTGIEFEFFPPSQTSGGIQGVKSEAIDIGGVSRTLSSQETGDQITYLPLVETPLVIAVHDSVTGISNITGDQIQAIYSGQITNWKTLGGPDAAIVLFDFTEDENEKQVLRQAYLGDDLAISKTAIVFAEDDELVETAAITEFSIAAIPYEDELDELPFKVLNIDGIAPSVKTLQSGDYPMALDLGIVLDKLPSVETQSFLEFATSLEGRQILADHAYITIEAN